MYQLLDLSGGVLLHLVRFLDVEDAISFSMASRALYDLFQNYERSFWIETLSKTQQVRPLPCPPGEDITKYDSKTLRSLVQHFNRLNRNWRNEKPLIVGRVRTLTVDKNLDSIAHIAGTKYAITHSVFKCKLSVWSTENGKRLCSIPGHRRVSDLSTGWPEHGKFTIALLTHPEFFLEEIWIQVLTVDYGGPRVTMDIPFAQELRDQHSRRYRAIFLNADVVGVLYVNDEDIEDDTCLSPFHVLAFNIRTRQRTNIRVALQWAPGEEPYHSLWTGHAGTSFWDNNLYIHFEQNYSGAYQAWIPKDLLPYSENINVATQISYTLTPSRPTLHNRPHGSVSEGILTMKADFGVIASTIYTYESDKPITGIDFWVIDPASLSEARRTGHLPTPAPYPPVIIPGTIRTTHPSSWCLYQSTNSGLYMVLALEDWDGQPKIMVVHLQLPDYRFTVHTIETPLFIKQQLVSGFFIDERRGSIAFYVAKGRVFVLDYA